VKIFILTLLSAFSFQFSICYAENDISVVEKPFMEGRYDRTVYEAQKLIDGRARQGYEIYYLKGLSELKLGRFKDARQSFDAIISKYSSSNRAFDAYAGIGDSYFLEGDPVNAAKIYHEIKEKFPYDKNITIIDSRLNDCRDRPASMPPQSVIEAPKGYFSVQAGCFKNKRNADKLSAKLAQCGYQSYVELPLASGDKLYRVKVGRGKTKGETENIAAKLNKDGYKTKICDDNRCQ
jgi:tetratricopeptide (TPR) repeat protein